MKYLGRFWNDRDIEIYNINGRNIALHGWNGEKYLNCYELSSNLIDIIKENIEVIPEYEEIDEDNYKIVNYKIISE